MQTPAETNKWLIFDHDDTRTIRYKAQIDTINLLNVIDKFTVFNFIQYYRRSLTQMYKSSRFKSMTCV